MVDWWGDFQAGLEDSLLPLEADVLGPSDETAQITLGLDVLTDLEVTGTSDKEGIFHSLYFGFLHGQRGGCHLLSLLLCLVRFTLLSCSYYQVLIPYLLLNHGVRMSGKFKDLLPLAKLYCRLGKTPERKRKFVSCVLFSRVISFFLAFSVNFGDKSRTSMKFRRD